MNGAAFLRIKKLRGGGIVARAARHNKRAIQEEIGASVNIDRTRTHLNETLQGPATADAVAQLAKDRMHAAGVRPIRKDAVMGLEIVFSLPLGYQIDDRAYFGDCAAWAAAHFGGPSNILSVDIHRDEAAPHCHVLLLPIRNGRMVGSEMMGDRKVLMTTQTKFHEMVASRYGLRKAPARLSGTTKQLAAKAVLQRLQETSDAVLRSRVWGQVRAAIENDPGPFAMSLGIELKASPKRQRTMTEIFIGKGKGKANEASPIGFTAPPSRRNLCSVGFAPKPPPFTATNSAGQESSDVNGPCPKHFRRRACSADTPAHAGADRCVAGAVDSLGEIEP